MTAGVEAATTASISLWTFHNHCWTISLSY